MTKEMTLSPRELQYIAALTDATELLGISDAFFGMEDGEILQEAQRLRTSLEKKGYAEMDFDGGFTLTAEVREAVDICADCDVFIVADKNRADKPQLREQYYLKDGRTIKVSDINGSYLLEEMSGTEEVLESITGDIEWTPSAPSQLQCVSLKKDMLAGLKSRLDGFDESGGVSALTTSGCDELSAKMIADGLFRKAHYYAVVAIVCRGEQKGVHSAMLIETDSGIYKLTPVANSGEELIRFDPLNHSRAKSALADVVLGVFPEVSEGFK